MEIFLLGIDRSEVCDLFAFFSEEERTSQIFKTVAEHWDSDKYGPMTDDFQTAIDIAGEMDIFFETDEYEKLPKSLLLMCRFVVEKVNAGELSTDSYSVAFGTVLECVSKLTGMRKQDDGFHIFENHYFHEECDEKWSDRYSCMVDDDCPKCGRSISPFESIDLLEG